MNFSSLVSGLIAMCSVRQVFPELDEKVQERAFEYLESLGIGECCEYVASKIEDKEQQLYMEWLEGSVKFLE
jgi:hypothetical protein